MDPISRDTRFAPWVQAPSKPPDLDRRSSGIANPIVIARISQAYNLYRHQPWVSLQAVATMAYRPGTAQHESVLRLLKAKLDSISEKLRGMGEDGKCCPNLWKNMVRRQHGLIWVPTWILEVILETWGFLAEPTLQLEHRLIALYENQAVRGKRSQKGFEFKKVLAAWTKTVRQDKHHQVLRELKTGNPRDPFACTIFRMTQKQLHNFLVLFNVAMVLDEEDEEGQWSPTEGVASSFCPWDVLPQPQTPQVGVVEQTPDPVSSLQPQLLSEPAAQATEHAVPESARGETEEKTPSREPASVGEEETLPAPVVRRFRVPKLKGLGLVALFCLLFGVATLAGYVMSFRNEAIQMLEVNGPVAARDFAMSRGQDKLEKRAFLGYSLFRTGEYQKAETVLYRLLGDKPPDKIKAEARYYLGQIAMVTNRLEEAEGLVNSAVQTFIQHQKWDRVYYGLQVYATILCQMERLDEAREKLDHARYYWEQAAREYVPHLGQYYGFEYLHFLRMEDYLAALTAAEQSLILFEGDGKETLISEARSRVAFASALLGDYSKAVLNARSAEEFFSEKDSRFLVFNNLVWIAIEGPTSASMESVEAWLARYQDPELKFQLSLALKAYEDNN